VSKQDTSTKSVSHSTPLVAQENFISRPYITVIAVPPDVSAPNTQVPSSGLTPARRAPVGMVRGVCTREPAPGPAELVVRVHDVTLEVHPGFGVLHLEVDADTQQLPKEQTLCETVS
jgi:hypothetical protein